MLKAVTTSVRFRSCWGATMCARAWCTPMFLTADRALSASVQLCVSAEATVRRM